jgi:hypothetical protein
MPLWNTLAATYRGRKRSHFKSILCLVELIQVLLVVLDNIRIRIITVLADKGPRGGTILLNECRIRRTHCILTGSLIGHWLFGEAAVHNLLSAICNLSFHLAAELRNELDNWLTR